MRYEVWLHEAGTLAGLAQCRLELKCEGSRRWSGSSKVRPAAFVLPSDVYRAFLTHVSLRRATCSQRYIAARNNKSTAAGVLPAGTVLCDP